MEVVTLESRPLDLGHFLRESLLSQRFADLALCCSGGHRFLAHRLVLSAASPYLREVLLAHNSASSCEPITVIFTEVDGTELAALLGFVYTGSAQVPRARLQSFLRIADALQIQLPPLPTNYRSSPKLNDACNESDCRQRRLARRHVANQVIASPWNQIAQPYHSPRHKIIVPRCPLQPLQFEYGRSTEGQVIQAEPPKLCRLTEYAISLNVSRLCNELTINNDNGKNDNDNVNDIDNNNNNRNNNRNNSSNNNNNNNNNINNNVNNDDDDDNYNNNEYFASELAVVAQPQQHEQLPQQHLCGQCNKRFTSYASLKVHLRSHSGEKPFRCADCGKLFSKLRNYKYHRSVHEGTHEFAAICAVCGKYFNDRGYLSSHMKIHRNRKEYGCTECGKSFNQRVAFNMHTRIHTGLKPHQCDQCGKAFSRKMLLKQHLRTHSGERPYQCQVCHKAFADRSNMTLHTRLHSGLKPYQCNLCSKAFTKKHHLKTHLNYHTGTKPYACPNCQITFSQSSNMRTHFKKCALKQLPLHVTVSSS